MATVTIQEAKATLSEIIHRLAPGEEVVITENNQPVARIVPTPPADHSAAATDSQAWRRFVDETAGAWQGEPITRDPQGDYEVRQPWE